MSTFNSTSGFNYTIGSNATTPANVTGISSAQSTHHGLPLQPRLTPACGVAGALLILTGIPYAFVSLKWPWLYTSIGSAYLTSLCFTVLIVDVMSVPDQGISNTVQGAFLIAIVLPGIVVGGLLSWLIKWPARCMGCIVGGFCMAMWLETLCPGGLIKSSKMTAVLICVMCAVSLAPSIPYFKKWVERWVELAYMIFSAFSGSTALVLGIDCYSRAGLKEFWVYTWHLHRVELFGFETTTYPTTRGIKAETAIIPVVFFFAVAVQFKFWKPLRAKKERDAARLAQLTDDQERQALETGHTFVMVTEKERAAWEEKHKEPEEKNPGVSQKQVDPPSPSKVMKKVHGAKDFIMDRFKPDHRRVLIPKDTREQHHDEISPVKAHRNSAKAVSDTPRTNRPVPFAQNFAEEEREAEEQVDEEQELRGHTSVIPAFAGYMLDEQGRMVDEDGEEVEFTLRPTSRPPPVILPQTDDECDTPLDEMNDVNMRSISPLPPALAERISALNLASDMENTEPQSVYDHVGGENEYSRHLDRLHKDEACVPTTVRMSQEDLSEWNRHLTQEPNVDEGNANEGRSTLGNLDDTVLQYAHLRSKGKAPATDGRVKSFTQFPELDPIESQGREEVMSRTHEWSKTLNDAEPTSRASSIQQYDISLWQGFEGVYPTKGSAERLEEHDLAASQPQPCVLSRSSAVKENKRRSRPISASESHTAILPTPVRSARVSKRNASLPVLNTRPTLLETAATRNEHKKNQISLSRNFTLEESQGVVARREFGSYSKFDDEDSSPNVIESTDLDEITLSQARRALHARKASNSQVSSISSHGHRASSSVSGQSPIHSTARTTPILASPGPSVPPFVMVAHPLQSPYPMPPCEGVQSTVPPLWMSNGALSPMRPSSGRYSVASPMRPSSSRYSVTSSAAAIPQTNSPSATPHPNSSAAAIPQTNNPRAIPHRRFSAPVDAPPPEPKVTLMNRVEFDEEFRKQEARNLLITQRRGIADATKARQREKALRRRTLEASSMMRAGQFDDAHREAIRKLQRQAEQNSP